MPPRISPLRGRLRRPPLTLKQIRSWAEQYHKRHGQWPTARSGPIPGTRETWSSVVTALARGLRGLPRGNTLSRLLDAWFPVLRSRPCIRCPLTVEQILAWADAYHRRTGLWPRKSMPPAIPGSGGETWMKIHTALYSGGRGLRGHTTLLRFLARHRDLSDGLYSKRPRFSKDQIIRWARAHHRETGQWPDRYSGPISSSPGTTWYVVTTALANGSHGLPGGSTLLRFLEEHCPEYPGSQWRRSLTEGQILRWAKAHHARTGRWPVIRSGPVHGVRGESWRWISMALKRGRRGLRGGRTLRDLLLAKFGDLRYRYYSSLG